MPAPSQPVGSPGTPTGDAKFRKGPFGKLILQYAYRPYIGDPAMGEAPILWADAPEWALSSIRYYRKHRGLEPLI